MFTKRNPAEVKVVKPGPRFREQEEFLRFPMARPEGPMGLPADISALGYKVRFTDEITGGYRVNVLRDDGRAVAKGIKLRRYLFSWEKLVDDPVSEDRVALKLSSNCPAVLRISVMGDGEITKGKIDDAVNYLRHPSREERMGASLLLARAAREGFGISEAVPALSGCLSDDARGVRIDAAYALGEYAISGGDISGAAAGLENALSHKDARTRKAAAWALMHHYISSDDHGGIGSMLVHPMADVRETGQAVMRSRSELQALDKE